MADAPANRLRAGTFLVPSVPVEFFESILSYLESKLNFQTTLLYESRWDAVPDDRLFQVNELDLAWMCSTGYLDLMKKPDHNMQLLPISTVHDHSQAKNRVGIFADVIVHKNVDKTVQTFEDLRGCSWAYSQRKSFIGYNLTLDNLKKVGANASFFRNSLATNSHLESLKMVISNKVDATVVDANCLALYLENNDMATDEVIVLTSWGLLPPYVMVLNKSLADDVKEDIQNILLEMHSDVYGSEILKKFKVLQFSDYDPSEVFQTEVDINKNVKDMDFGNVYY